nr:ketopantoate reductase family protein [Gammaproteobacteria bacterium]
MARYIIYGAGGIGGAIGASLHQHGREVVLIARGEHLRKMRADGLHLRRPSGDARVLVNAVDGPAAIEYRGDEVVMFCMKSQDTAPALLALREAAGSEVPVVMCQNGVANERMAARLFRNVYAMLVYMPTTHLEPGVVRAESKTAIGVLDCGVYPTGVDDRIKEVCRDLRSAEFSATPDPKVMELKYGKLLVNLGNALEALCGLGSDTKDIGKALRDEAARCFAAAGIRYVDVEGLRARHKGVVETGEIPGAARGGGSSW